MALSLRARTRGVLERYQLSPQKRLSQHFLVDDEILMNILDACSLSPSDQILEIGAGLGLFTELLSEHVTHVFAVEIDKELCSILAERFSQKENITLIADNILKIKPDTYSRELKVIGNIPYHISGSILRWILEHRNNFSSVYLMVQKEVAERIVASPRNKSYGVLSVLCQYFTTPELLFSIPSSAFLPPPKVESAFVKLLPKRGDRNDSFVSLVKQSFAYRRKTIYNNLKSWKNYDWNAIFQETGITGKERAEELPVATFERLAKCLL